MLTVDEVAARLRLSRPTIYRMLAAGILPGVRVSGHRGAIRVPAAELDDWLSTRRTDR